MFRELLNGFALPAEGTAFFFKNRSLWKYAVKPFLVMLLIYGGVLWLSLCFSTALARKIAESLEAQNNFWSSMAGVISGGVTVILIVLILAVLLFTASIFYETLAGPFCDRLILSYLHLKGDLREPEIPLKSSLNFLCESLFFNLNTLWGSLFLSLVSLFLPVIGQILLFLFVSYRLGITWFMPAGFVCGYPLARQKKVLANRKAKTLGFGMAAYLFWLIPFAPFIFLPGLVLGGTELLLEAEQEELKPSCR